MLCPCGYRRAGGARPARQPPASPGWARWSKGPPRPKPQRAAHYAAGAAWITTRDCAGGSDRAVGVGGETLATAALGGHVGVGEGELLVQAHPGEVDPGAGHQRRALRVDVDPYAALLDHLVAFTLFPGQVHHITPPGTSGALDAKAHAQRVGVGSEEALDAFQRGGGKLDIHGADSTCWGSGTLRSPVFCSSTAGFKA